MGCSLKETVDLYERTVAKKEAAEEVELIEEPSIENTFEWTLAKLRPEKSSLKNARCYPGLSLRSLASTLVVSPIKEAHS